MMFFIINTYK